MREATFVGGVRLSGKKDRTKNQPISRIPDPIRVAIPLLQHAGAPCLPVVSPGQLVKRGSLLGKESGSVSAPVHASVSGRVIELCSVPHPSGKPVQAVAIQSDGADEWATPERTSAYADLSPEELRQRIRDAGIVGMGGAAFPTHVKLSPPPGKRIDTVIINGIECEPYLTADCRLMIEKPEQIVEGLRIFMKVLGAARGCIGIEADKSEALEVMRHAVRGDSAVSVRALSVKYPQGAEKMLIAALTGRRVPPRGLPMDVGVVVQNVATANATCEAVRFGKPLIERVVTITGPAISAPRNALVRIGTPVSDLIAACGGSEDAVVKLVMGGPMMGVALGSMDVPVCKGTSGIVAFDERNVPASADAGPCIRCGRCLAACAMGLMPSVLSGLSQRGLYQETGDYNVFDCLECGACAYVCPAKRPIVHLIKLAKAMIKK